jgi:hypothetical protein
MRGHGLQPFYGTWVPPPPCIPLQCPSTHRYVKPPPQPETAIGLQCKFTNHHRGLHCAWAGPATGDIFWADDLVKPDGILRIHTAATPDVIAEVRKYIKLRGNRKAEFGNARGSTGDSARVDPDIEA